MAIPQDARHIANAEGDFAPQHENNWLIEIGGLDGDAKDLITLSLVSSALPPESNEEISLPYGNETRYVAGKAQFDPIPLVVRDYVDRPVRAALMAWRRQVYDPETGNVGLPSQYKKQAEIILQASNGTLSRSCRLIGIWPQALNPGTLSMDSANPVQIEMTLRYDRALWTF